MLTSTPVRPAFRPYLVVVSRVRRLTPHFIRVTFTGDDLVFFGTAGRDQRIKLVVPTIASDARAFAREMADESGPDGFAVDWYGRWRGLPDARRNPLRTYTVRAVRPERAEVDVDFVAHGDAGPASAWVESVQVGAEALLIGPDARVGEALGGIEWHPGAATSLLLAGDETAVPAVSGILESLPAEATGAVFLEIPAEEDRLDLRLPAGVDLTWIVRAPGAAAGEALAGAVRGWALRFLTAHHHGVELDDIDIDGGILWEVPEESSDPGLYAWVAGEAAAVKRIRRCLVTELGVDRRRVAFMGYWRRGRSEGA